MKRKKNTQQNRIVHIYKWIADWNVNMSLFFVIFSVHSPRQTISQLSHRSHDRSRFNKSLREKYIEANNNEKKNTLTHTSWLLVYVFV